MNDLPLSLRGTRSRRRSLWERGGPVTQTAASALFRAVPSFVSFALEKPWPRVRKLQDDDCRDYGGFESRCQSNFFRVYFGLSYFHT